MPPTPPHPSAPLDPLFGSGLADDAARHAVEPVFQPQFDGDDRTDDHPPSFSSEHGAAASARAPGPQAAREAEDSPLPGTDPGPFEDGPPPLERGPATPLPAAARSTDRVAPYVVVAVLVALTLLTAWWSARS
jgi:hypothetical protein